MNHTIQNASCAEDDITILPQESNRILIAPLLRTEQFIKDQKRGKILIGILNTLPKPLALLYSIYLGKPQSVEELAEETDLGEIIRSRILRAEALIRAHPDYSLLV